MSHPHKRCYEFGSFCLHVDECVLMRGGAVVPLMPKTVDILLALVRRGGEVVSKEELINEIWPDVIVEENNLTKHISTLRRVLGEGGGQPLIETLPKRGYRFVAALKEERGLPSTAAQKQAVAVLPFKLLGFAEGDAYLGLGLTDALITRLVRLKNVAVRPISAVLQYNSLAADPVAAGRELGVTFVLDGRLQKVGEKFRATLHLIQAEGGDTLWAATLDENLNNIFALEDTISAQVAGALMLRLSPPERQALARRHTENLQAYNAYLTGRYHWNFFSLDSLKLAYKYYEQALEHDPEFALAYAGITEYCLAVSWMGGVSPHKVMPQGKAAALKALDLDPELAQAHVSLGVAKLVYDFDWAGAEECFLRAIDLNLADEVGYYWYALLLVGASRFDEARAVCAVGRQINPLTPILIDVEGLIHYYERQYDRTIECCRELCETIPHYVPALMITGLSQIGEGSYEQAIDTLTKGVPASGRAGAMIAALGYAYAKAGDSARARALLDELTDETRQVYVQPSYVAVILANLGEREQALEYLQKAYDERHGFLIFLNVEPAFDPLRADPRFADIESRIGLTPKV
jgi:DNA-binding winged helix-turn-helix (wHTH) protein